LGKTGSAPGASRELPTGVQSIDLVCVLANMALSGFAERGA
jgi:hypothetical protein